MTTQTTPTHRTRHHEQAAAAEAYLQKLATQVAMTRDRLARHELAALVAELDEEHPDAPPATITVLVWDEEVECGAPFTVTVDEVLDADGDVLATVGGELSWEAHHETALLGWSDGQGAIDVARVRAWARVH